MLFGEAFWGHLTGCCISHCPGCLRQIDGFGGRVWLGDPDTSKHTITARTALAMLCWAAEKRSGYHHPAGPKPCGKLIHTSHIFPTPYVVFHCLRRRPFQLSEAAVLARKCVLYQQVHLFASGEFLEHLGAGFKRGAQGQELDYGGSEKSHGLLATKPLEKECFGRSGRILMCHLRKVTHQEEDLWETTAPRLLPDMRFWLVSDVDWGQGKRCSNRWWLDRTKADMPAFSHGAVVLELFSVILQG